jgi:ATP-dependent DNA ligase
VAYFEVLHSRANDGRATACAFDLFMLNGDDQQRKPFSERKKALRKALRRMKGGINTLSIPKARGADVRGRL